MRKKTWNKDDLKKAIESSLSLRQVIHKLGLVEAGGNYDQIKKYIKEYNFTTQHFTGRGWRKDKTFATTWRKNLNEILILDSDVQSFKLKNRLIIEGLKERACEMCGWCEMASDGRIPVELDHVNGDKRDNRIQNLRILCPNCHSLQSTHRGLNKKK